jgi:hypothetical protein
VTRRSISSGAEAQFPVAKTAVSSGKARLPDDPSDPTGLTERLKSN